MSKRFKCNCALLAAGVVLLGSPVWAEDNSSTAAKAGDDQIDRLEALIQAQQKKIDALEQSVAATSSQAMDRARVEEMKKQIREVLSEQEFRESLMPSTVQAGYDNGFYIRSSDEKFLMKFNGQLQFRWTYYNSNHKNRYLSPGFPRHDRAGFDIVRMNFDISGHAYTKDLTYFLEIGAASPNSYNAALNYAWVNYRIIDELQIKAGLMRVASTRANMGSNAKYQFVEAPMFDAVYGLNDGLGVRLWGQLFNKKVVYFIDVVNSINNATTQTITTDENLATRGHDNTPGILARVVWHALAGPCGNPIMAADDPGRFDSFCDMEHSMSPTLDLGMHYAFTEDHTTQGYWRMPFPRKTLFRKGGFGLASNEGLQINQFGIDAAFKYQGFSITGEYALRLLDVRDSDHPPYTPLFLLTSNTATTAQHGGYVQCGYFLPIPGWENKFEVVGRVGGISASAGGAEGVWDYGGGFNYYIQGHKVKLQADVTKIYEVPISNSTYSLANVNDNALIFRLQLQVAF